MLQYFLLLQYFVCRPVEQVLAGGTAPRWTTFSRLDDGVFFILKVDCALDCFLHGEEYSWKICVFFVIYILFASFGTKRL